MISYGKQTIDQSDIDAVIDALKSDWLTQGPSCEIFEKNINKSFGSKYSCAVANGTAALHLTGLALGWQPGDYIITTPLTFLATSNSIIYSRAYPVFVDIDSKSYTIDPNLVEDKIVSYKSEGKKIRAIIGVDFAGHPCNWKDLRYLADKYNLELINDNCHALGASYLEDKYYAIKYADVVTQSYHPVKHITTGEGGAVLTNNKKIDQKIRSLRTHGINKQERKKINNKPLWYYEMNELGFNYRITDFQCALGSNQLTRLESFINKRRQIAQVYDKAFLNHDWFKIPLRKDSIDHAYHLYALQINFKDLKINKNDFFFKMKELGINLQVHYIPVHLQPYYQKEYGYKSGDFSISENFYKNEVSLPIYPNLSFDDVQIIIDKIIKITST